MTLYQYEAFTDKGKKIKGWVNADTINDAKQDLLSRRVLLTKIQSVKKQASARLSKADLMSLTRELSKLLKAGLPLYESLMALEEKYQDHNSHYVILSLCDSIRSGKTLSEAMRMNESSFDLLYCSMIANAESSGTLLEALEEIADLLSKQQKLKKQIAQALLYPGILVAFCFVVIGALLFFVIPSLFELFEGRKLHPFTASVIALSQFAIRFKVPLFIGVFMGFLGLFFAFISQKIRRFFYGKFVHVWGLKKILMKIALIRFSRSCGTMLEEGIPLLRALEMARSTVDHPTLEKILFEVEKTVMEGGSIVEEFKRSSDIPTLFTRMLAIAEESGRTGAMLMQLTQIYEEELEKSFQQVTTIAQPVILLVLGLIVGLVLLSVLLPLTDVSSFIST